MELECDLGAIQNEELLRKMWQQSEDSERKRQIRTHLYKLRESRLRNLYRHEPDSIAFEMSEPNGNTLSGFGKDPLATSHGDALLDQNFQSLKSKEVRDSMSPTHELKFHSMSLTQPNSTGWDVQTSSEVSPDGRAYRTETLAKTDERSRPTSQTSPGRTVASRRNIFEKQSPSPDGEPNGRRPSYMDHTKSSLEHIRRDSLEINKTHYSRKSSVEDDIGLEPRNPNAAVKFDVPRRGSRPEPVRTTNSEEIEIEEIFDLQTLEQLLETVSSYELRRRIRAQIRLIKKNMINASSTTSSITTTTITSKGSASSTPSRSPLPPRRTAEQPQQLARERSHSPEPRSSSRRTEQLDSATAHGKPPVKPRERSASPAQTRRRSPTGKAQASSTTTTTTRTTSGKGKDKDKANEKPSPIWADRSKVLRASGSSSPTPTPRKGSNSSSISSSSTSKLMRSSNTSSSAAATTSSSSSTTTTNRSSSSKRREEDSITSSYGVGPTDENGLPLFGIRALKKKIQPTAPCETKQEVTGYVIEEQFYSDDKSPPRRERKELIYSSNPAELATLQQQLEHTSQPSGQIKLQRELKLIDADELPLAAAAAIETGTRRGSVKELTERFIQKESVADEAETEDSESNDVCSVIEMETPQMRQKSSSSTTRTSSSTRSFLNTSGEDRLVGSVDDVLERMRNADNVMEPGDSTEDREARALLNKFLGASVIMQGVETMLPAGQRQEKQQQLPRGNNNNSNNNGSQAVKTTRISSSSYSSKAGSNSNSNSNSSSSNINSSNSSSSTRKSTSSAPVTRTTCDIEEIWDEQLLRQLLEQASTYEERRKIRARLRELMAEREEQQNLKAGGEKVAAKEEEESSASEYEEIIEEVTDDDDDDDSSDEEQQAPAKPKETEKEKEKETESIDKKLAKVELSKQVVNKQLLSDSQVDSVVQAQHKQQSSTTSERTETKSKDGGAVVTTTTTKVTTRTVSGSAASKNISPLAKFKQLDKAAAQQQAQKSSPTTSTPTTPGGSAQPLFKFTDPALNARAATVKDQLLQWCQHKTQEYENVQISNFSSSWSDGLAFCALIHHFLPDAFDYSKLTKQTRKHNFELAFSVADEKAGIAPLLDVEDMVEMSRPDWKCVFVYVQSIYRRFRNCQ
ncbi:smoothelin isoform X7 [Drosophila montana]|uniref:smoothelin isoform X7 n=1 Tax=Drosophila montana TaxID=40370 RepID=UPI00313D58BF